MPDIFALHVSSVNPNGLTVLYTLITAFLLSMLLAITYVKTFRGLSYSRNYVQTIVLGAIVASIIMQAIGDSLARGLGMIGALAIIRFRTNFKDPRDIIFIFATMAAGIACGVYAYSVAIVGTLVFCSTSFLLYVIPFQKENSFDGIIRFSIHDKSESWNGIEQILKEHCKQFVLITMQDTGNRWDYAYHIKLRPMVKKIELMQKLKQLDSVSNVNLLCQESTIEL